MTLTFISLRRCALALALHAVTAIALVAQRSDTPAPGNGTAAVALPRGGPDRPTLEAVRECPRYRCEATVELTVKGTRLRVGDSTRVSSLYLIGGAASRYLAVVPSARFEQQRGRQKLRQRLLIAAVTAAATVVVFAPGFRDPEGDSFPRRTAAAAVIVGTGVYFGGRQGRAAEPHFDEAVRLFNVELRP